MPEIQLHFVISAPRSGSTWLCQALNRHPAIFATEQRLFGDYFGVWPDRSGHDFPRQTFDHYARAFSGHYFYRELGMNRATFLRKFERSWLQFLASFGARHSGKPVLVDKITPYPGTSARVIEKIQELLPQSKIIQLLRDGRDVVTSGTFDWLQKDGEGTPRHDFFVKRTAGMKLQRLFDDAAVTNWCNNWRECVDALNGDVADLTVQYEAMIQNQADELVRIFKLLGVESSSTLAENCADQASFLSLTGRQRGDEQPMAKTRKGIVGDWRNYFTKSDARLFHRLAGPQLIRSGYESNSDWVENCPSQLELIC